MENFLKKFFPTIGANANNNKIINLQMEIDKLNLCLKMSNEANFKRKAAMDIMKHRIEEQAKMLKKMDGLLKDQSLAMHKMQAKMKIQQKRLEHINSLDEKFNNLQTGQGEVLHFAQKYNKLENG